MLYLVLLCCLASLNKGGYQSQIVRNVMRYARELANIGQEYQQAAMDCYSKWSEKIESACPIDGFPVDRVLHLHHRLKLSIQRLNRENAMELLEMIKTNHPFQVKDGSAKEIMILAFTAIFLAALIGKEIRDSREFLVNLQKSKLIYESVDWDELEMRNQYDEGSCRMPTLPNKGDEVTPKIEIALVESIFCDSRKATYPKCEGNENLEECDKKWIHNYNIYYGRLARQEALLTLAKSRAKYAQVDPSVNLWPAEVFFPLMAFAYIIKLLFGSAGKRYTSVRHPQANLVQSAEMASPVTEKNPDTDGYVVITGGKQ
eukprot:NODE_516_length_6577_cov_0.589379.p3 type:complete len:316 gc:universal NODE_516_length_6577_cov_0.589379:6471-5524(-)